MLAWIWISALLIAQPSSSEGWVLDEHRPATWSDDLETLVAQGLGQSRGAPVFEEAGEAFDAHTRPKAATQPAVLYVNFGGASLTAGADDATRNQTAIDGMAGDFPPYEGQAGKREAVLQAVREDWSAYNAVVTDTRPETGPYVMNMVGPSAGQNDSILGIAILDCGDRNPNNITFAFHSGSDPHTAATTATTISQELGHSFGLEHVDNPADIMNPFNSGGDATFRDECTSLSKPAVCAVQHEAQCGSSGLQNAHLELMSVLGPGRPNRVEPAVEVIAPVRGEHFEDGEAFEIVFTTNEAFVVYKAALFVNDELVDTDDAAPFGWSAKQASSGRYDLRVEALDTRGVLGISETVQVIVGEASDVDTESPPPGPLGPRAAQDGNTCTVGADPTPLASIGVGLLVLGLRRRRLRTT